jgi:tripartite-type tricarboxylate transporter receptor subunit TctC
MSGASQRQNSGKSPAKAAAGLARSGRSCKRLRPPVLGLWQVIGEGMLRLVQTVSRGARISSGLIACCALLFAAGAARGDVADFYRGRTVNIVIGYSAGGGYDVFARLLAQHMGRHIPGHPTLLPQNMPGAGSRKAGMYLYEVAPKDGSVFGTIGRNEAVAPLIEEEAKFDGTKFTWIGSIADDNSICITWHSSPIKSWADMQQREVTLGALAVGDNTVTVPLALKNLFGAKLRLVTGYPGTNDVFLALERGEVDGACGVSWRPIMLQRRDWIEGKKINVLVEVALEKDPSLGDTPLITEFVRDPEQLKVLSLLIATQAMARPFLAPPGIPEDRRQALRTAFDATMADPTFLADAQRAALYVHPLPGAGIDALLRDLYAVPKAIAAKAAKAIQN